MSEAEKALGDAQAQSGLTQQQRQERQDTLHQNRESPLPLLSWCPGDGQ